MKQLTPEAFERARYFIMSKARPLERALFKFHFEEAGSGDVLAELAQFQNTDGGFGNALEPDLRTPSSSALATAIGLKMLKELDCSADRPMAKKAVTYLLETYDNESHVWRVVPLDTHHHPHAPWWHDENDSLAKTFDQFRIIPRALIVGLLHHYSALVPAEWLDDITDETVSYIETVSLLGEGGGSDLEYAVHLAETINLPRHYAKRLTSRILKAIPEVVVRDPAQWESYCITPLTAVSSPHTVGANLLPDELQIHLDYKIEKQSPEGTWNPTWTWGDMYPDVWKRAELEWQGQLTLQTLIQLREFGRIKRT